MDTHRTDDVKKPKNVRYNMIKYLWGIGWKFGIDQAAIFAIILTIAYQLLKKWIKRNMGEPVIFINHRDDYRSYSNKR